MPMVLVPVTCPYTYCISSNDSASILSYQEFPTSVQCGEAIARRRKEERQASSASRGIVRRWGRCSSRVRYLVVPDRERVAERCHFSDQPWTSAVTLPHGRNG